jgi:hypothetical protein
MHDRDGVHLKNKGYLYMWEKARRMAALGTPAPLTTGSVAAAASPAVPAPAAPAAQFELAASSSADSGGGWREPKIYVLHVKRIAAAAQIN